MFSEATKLLFWSKVKIGKIDECWPYMAAKFHNGYGAFSVNRAPKRAHRIAFEIHNGFIVHELRVCHSCDNPPCCNPAHLWQGDDIANVKDRDQKGRTAKGEKNGFAKLTAKQASEIKTDPRTQRAIAADFGVCKSTVGYIKRGEYWSG